MPSPPRAAASSRAGLAPEAVDCHLHAGLERRETLDVVFRRLREDGRRIVGLVDHAELYVEDPPQWAAAALDEAAGRLDVAGLSEQYSRRLEGPAAFYRASRESAARFGEGLVVAVGLEVSGDWLDRIPQEWLDGADFLGICTSQPRPGRPWGEHMAELVRRAAARRTRSRMGLVLHHPFRWRILELGRDPAARIPEAAGFTEADARAAADALSEAGAVAELNFASYWQFAKDARLLAAAKEAFDLLREAGARFSIGSDAHAITSLPAPYRPSEAMTAFGIAARDVRLPEALQAALEGSGGLRGPEEGDADARSSRV